MNRRKSGGMLILWVVFTALMMIALPACNDSGGNGDDDDDDDTLCSLEGEARCSPGTTTSVELCTVRADGELGWQFSETCGEGLICQLGSCVIDTNLDGDQTDDDDDVTEGCKQISVADNLNFGAVMLGNDGTQTLTVSSIGTCSVTMRQVQIIHPPNTDEVFVLDNPLEGDKVLTAGDTMNLTFTYTPTMPKVDTAQVVITSDADNSPSSMVVLSSEYKGTSNLVFYTTGASPDERVMLDSEEPLLQFGNTTLGSSVVLPLYICNEGTDNRAITLSGWQLKYGLVAHYTVLMDPNPASNPVFLSPGTTENPSCITASITYAPQANTIYPDLHDDVILFAHDAQQVFGVETESTRAEVEISGACGENLLEFYPSSIDFGYVNLNEPVMKTVTVTNHSGGEIVIENVLKSGNHCEEFQVFPGDCADGCTLAEDDMVEFSVAYQPTNTGQDTGCNFTVDTELTGQAEFQRAAMTGWGREPNEAPTAKIANYDSGPDIAVPMQIEVGEQYTFFGDISSDPERNYPLTFEWSLIAPDLSNAPDRLYYSANSSGWQRALVTFTPDVNGQYMLSLVVTDTEHAVSQPKTIYLNTSQSDKITVEMTYTGSGTMNTQLTWRDPNGGACSDNNMLSNGFCNNISTDCGRAMVTAHTGGASEGTREEIVHVDACDGAYQIGVQFMESCAGWDLSWICLDEKSTNVTVKITLNDDLTPACTLTTHLSDEGDGATWDLPRVLGEFRVDQLPCE